MATGSALPAGMPGCASPPVSGSIKLTAVDSRLCFAEAFLCLFFALSACIPAQPWVSALLLGGHLQPHLQEAAFRGHLFLLPLLLLLQQLRIQASTLAGWRVVVAALLVPSQVLDGDCSTGISSTSTHWFRGHGLTKNAAPGGSRQISELRIRRPAIVRTYGLDYHSTFHGRAAVLQAASSESACRLRNFGRHRTRRPCASSRVYVGRDRCPCRAQNFALRAREKATRRETLPVGVIAGGPACNSAFCE